jgi:hypothetical protein
VADTTIAKAALEFWQGLAIVIVSGGLGGLVYGIAALADGGRDNSQYRCTNGSSVSLYLFAKTLVGIGGGMAALLAALTVGRYLEPPKSTDLLSLTGLCFVAGYIGHRILPAVAARLEKDLSDTKKEVAETKKALSEAELATKQLQSQVDMGREVSRAQQILGGEQQTPPSEVERIRGSLESFRENYPLDRSLAIVLGRLYMWILHDRARAIQVLREFIAQKQAANLRDRDVADAWFNIACYYCVEVDGRRVNGWEDEAISALKTSIEIAPSNVADATTDGNLVPLKTSRVATQFEILTGTSKAVG